MRFYTSADVFGELRKRVESGTQREVAERLGFVPQYINDVLQGRRDISERLALALGFERQADRYRKVKGKQ